MVNSGVQPWLFDVSPYEGESLSHYLGRVRRANHLTPSGLGKMAGIGAVVGRWERFHFHPYPTQKQFEALGAILGLSPEQLWAMLPPGSEGMQCEPIRLCAACYGEVPCHRIEWQYKSRWKCDHHHLKILAKCPNCGANFTVPAIWEYGICSRCNLPFSAMAQLQKPG